MTKNETGDKKWKDEKEAAMCRKGMRKAINKKE